MEYMNNLPYSKDELFEDSSIELINEKIQKHSTCLDKIKRYNDFDKQQSYLLEKFDKTFTEKQLELLNQYIHASLICNEYEKCLAYYWGCKTVLDINSLK